MTIHDERVVLDTNVWIFGLRRHSKFASCSFVLERLNQLNVIIPLQILRELQVNLTKKELTSFFHLINQFPERVTIHWQKAKSEIIQKYRDLGCDFGDAVVAAHLEELNVNILITENRHFLKEIHNLPFISLSSAEISIELDKTS